MSRTSARMRFSVTSSHSAITATDTPRLEDAMILLSRLAFASRAAPCASTTVSTDGERRGFDGIRHSAFSFLKSGERR
jgi:hypothetical protein